MKKTTTTWETTGRLDMYAMLALAPLSVVLAACDAKKANVDAATIRPMAAHS